MLLVAALLHDIGKGGLTEHSVAGEPLARAIATRMGFDEPAVDAGRRCWCAGTCCSPRPRRPATRRTRRRPGAVADRLGTRRGARRCSLTLTEADARATSPKAWSTWRAGLVRDGRGADGGGAGRAVDAADDGPSGSPSRGRYAAAAVSIAGRAGRRRGRG